jgi:hypothetical protein
MTLPADVARCPGALLEYQWGLALADCCQSCQRRTTPPIDHPRVAHMAAPDFIAGECTSRIAPGEAA